MEPRQMASQDPAQRTDTTCRAAIRGVRCADLEEAPSFAIPELIAPLTASGRHPAGDDDRCWTGAGRWPTASGTAYFFLRNSLASLAQGDPL